MKNVTFSTFWTFCFYRLQRRFFDVEYRERHFWKNVNFSNFWTSVFYRLERRFFDVEYGKRHFWKNVYFSTFWTCCFYRLERSFFDVEYRKDIFLAYFARKKKVGTRAIFEPKPWVNHFGKMSNYRLFERLVFIA